MQNKEPNPISLRIINRAKVYSSIYHHKYISKQQLVESLHMSLSTVSQNLQTLEQEGLILRDGYFDSTGGRKSQIIQINRQSGISIGIGLQKEQLHLAAVDLYGSLLHSATIPLPYFHAEEYYSRTCDELHRFIRQNHLPAESILGVSIAAQGLVSADGQMIRYGVIMDNEQMRLSDFQKHIPWPCRLEHDSKAAGFLELWNHPDITDALVLLLNGNLGGAMIINGQLHRGMHMQSSIVEHLCIDPDGPLCYCGRRGCLETFCSANALKASAGTDISSFFMHLRGKNPYAVSVWDTYLDHLAYAIRNINIVVDGVIIISGYLAPFFTPEDTTLLLEKINDNNPFPLSADQILFGTQGQYTPAIGAALYYIREFVTAQSQTI